MLIMTTMMMITTAINNKRKKQNGEFSLFDHNFSYLFHSITYLAIVTCSIMNVAKECKFNIGDKNETLLRY